MGVQLVIIGVSTGAFYPDYLTEEAIDAAARLGFPLVEILLQTAGEYAPAFIRELAGIARDAAVAVHSLHTLTSLHAVFDPYPRRRDEGRGAFLRAVDAAVTLGARCLVWHGLTRRDHAAGVSLAAYRETLGSLADVARRAGVTLTIENVGWCYVRDAESVVIVRDWCLPVGFTLDPYQASQAGSDGAALIEAMRGALMNVHLSDDLPGDGRHLPPGEGALDWPALLRQIAGTGYAGPLILEGTCGADLARLARSRTFVNRTLAAIGMET